MMGTHLSAQAMKLKEKHQVDLALSNQDDQTTSNQNIPANRPVLPTEPQSFLRCPKGKQIHVKLETNFVQLEYNLDTPSQHSTKRQALGAYKLIKLPFWTLSAQ